MPENCTRRGGVHGVANYDLLDVLGMVNGAFRGGPPSPIHPGLADVNCDGITEVVDIVLIVNMAFRGDAEPPPCFEFAY